MSQVDIATLEASASQIIELGSRRNLVLKLSGSLAYRTHCSRYAYLQLRGSRSINDIDIVGYFKDKRAVEEMMQDLGYRLDPGIATIPGLRRSIFYSRDNIFHCDVFYDALEFCHTIDLSRRLDVDHPTIPLMELLLQKLQIIELNLKDLRDMQMLLREHDVGAGDVEVINKMLLASYCSRRWGIWHTVMTNLSILKTHTAQDTDLTAEDKVVIEARIKDLQQTIDTHPKTLGWRIRALVGTKMRWYNTVEEIKFTEA